VRQALKIVDSSFAAIINLANRENRQSGVRRPRPLAEARINDRREAREDIAAGE
jgi:hypothetical protein